MEIQEHCNAWVALPAVFGGTSPMWSLIASVLNYFDSSDLWCMSSKKLHGYVKRNMLPVCRPLETLRPCGHNYFLPEYCTELHKHSFIINSLYRFVWLFAVYFFIICIVLLRWIVCIVCVCHTQYTITYLLTYLVKTISSADVMLWLDSCYW